MGLPQKINKPNAHADKVNKIQRKMAMEPRFKQEILIEQNKDDIHTPSLRILYIHVASIRAFDWIVEKGAHFAENNKDFKDKNKIITAAPCKLQLNVSPLFDIDEVIGYLSDPDYSEAPKTDLEAMVDSLS